MEIDIMIGYLLLGWNESYNRGKKQTKALEASGFVLRGGGGREAVLAFFRSFYAKVIK